MHTSLTYAKPLIGASALLLAISLANGLILALSNWAGGDESTVAALAIGGCISALGGFASGVGVEFASRRLVAWAVALANALAFIWLLRFFRLL